MNKLDPMDSGISYRPVRLFSSAVEVRSLEDGALLMRSEEALQKYDIRIGDWLDRWAAAAPKRAFLVEQTSAGERTLTYEEARSRALALAEGLLAYDLSVQHPLIIIAFPSIDYGVLLLAAHYIGVPVAPIAPAYALQSPGYEKLRRVFELLTPGMVAVSDGGAYRAVLDTTLPSDVPVVAFDHEVAGRQLALLRLTGDGTRSTDVSLATKAVNNATVAKLLFTSGSTGVPKAVVNTHGMLCAAAQMQRQVTPFLVSEYPVMVDWLPWNHTAGGNSTFNIILSNGGTLYIDPGKPTRELIGATLGLLRRVSPTLYFNVPMGYEALLPHLENDQALRERFFAHLKFMWYAAAPMNPTTWRALERLAQQTIGQRLLIVSGLGMTETSPGALFGNIRANGPGIVGVPIPGVELKLIPHDGALEALYRGPNVTPGYWRDPAATAAAFDASGFFISGDLLSFVDADHPEAGLRFEGRASDDFKLASGTRVAAGALRLRALAGLAPYIADVVVVGAGRNDVRILLFPDWSICREEFGFDVDVVPREVAQSREMQTALQKRFFQLQESEFGSARRIVAGLLVTEPPSVVTGELTEKGTINGRLLQRRRPQLLELLFGNDDSPLIVRPRPVSMRDNC